MIFPCLWRLKHIGRVVGTPLDRSQSRVGSSYSSGWSLTISSGSIFLMEWPWCILFSLGMRLMSIESFWVVQWLMGRILRVYRCYVICIEYWWVLALAGIPSLAAAGVSWISDVESHQSSMKGVLLRLEQIGSLVEQPLICSHF